MVLTKRERVVKERRLVFREMAIVMMESKAINWGEYIIVLGKNIKIEERKGPRANFSMIMI